MGGIYLILKYIRVNTIENNYKKSHFLAQTGKMHYSKELCSHALIEFIRQKWTSASNSTNLDIKS